MIINFTNVGVEKTPNESVPQMATDKSRGSEAPVRARKRTYGSARTVKKTRKKAEIVEIVNRNRTSKEAQSVNPNNFPEEAFPMQIQSLLREAKETLKFPKDYLGSSILFAASVGIGNSVKVQLKESWKESPILYIALVGPPGANKSHPINFALEPIISLEKESKKKYAFLMQKFKQSGGSVEKPIQQEYIVSDATTEALNMVLNNNPKGIGLYKDELISWIKDLNKYRSGSDQECWLSGWSGKPVKVTRKGSESIFISNPFISVIGSIQPSVLNEIADGNRGSNGFIDRILFAYPCESMDQSWSKKDINRKSIEDYGKMINKLFSLSYSNKSGDNPKPSVICFDEDAQKEYIEWYDKNKRIMNNVSDSLKALYSKLEIYVPRIALILQMMYWSLEGDTRSTISSKSLRGAIKLAEYYRAAGERVRKSIGISTIDLAKEKNDKLIESLKQGKTNVEIASVLGVTEGTIRYMRRKHGL